VSNSLNTKKRYFLFLNILWGELAGWTLKPACVWVSHIPGRQPIFDCMTWSCSYHPYHLLQFSMKRWFPQVDHFNFPAAKPPANHCPLCHQNHPSGEDGWKNHLMGKEGCKQNPRRLLALNKPTQGLNSYSTIDSLV